MAGIGHHIAARQTRGAGRRDLVERDLRFRLEYILSHIGALDTALLSYFNNIGDKGIICANFEGLFLVGTIGQFYSKFIKAGVVHSGNYGNVKHFAECIMSGNKCPSPYTLDFKQNELWDRYKALLARIFG